VISRHNGEQWGTFHVIRNRALHQLRMIAWQASDTAKAAANAVMQFDAVAVAEMVTKLRVHGHNAHGLGLLECAHTSARHSVTEHMYVVVLVLGHIVDCGIFHFCC